MTGVLIILVIIAYAASEGWCEAIFYDTLHRAGFVRSWRTNEHHIFTAQRTAFAACIAALSWVCGLQAFAISGAMFWPLFHEGTLYATRNALNPAVYKKGFWSEASGTGTELFSWPVWMRITLAVLGAIILVMAV